jgi:hypothetical protein
MKIITRLTQNRAWPNCCSNQSGLIQVAPSTSGRATCVTERSPEQ